MIESPKQRTRSLRANTIPAILTALLLAVSGACLHAQPDGPPPGGGPPGGGPPDFQASAPSLPSVNSQLKQLTRLLTLTADQQTQVKAILTDERAQMEATEKKAQSTASSDDGRPADIRDQIKSIRDDANAKIAALLADNQTAKFATWEKKQEKAEQNGDYMPGPPDGGPPPDGGGPGGGPGGGGPGGGPGGGGPGI